MNLLQSVQNTQLRTDLPPFRPGDTVRVYVKIKEGDKYRIQVFEGVVVFPLHSPIIEKLEIVKSGKVRRARLYYLRERRGKSARLKEVGRDTREVDSNQSESSS